MNNDLVSLSQLFDQRIYRIPDYQRGYAWASDQLDDFWDDLNNLSEDRFHYTGMLSLKRLGKETWEKWEEEKWIIRDNGYEAYHVVDGQQRLTTFIILMSSILRFAKKNGIDYICGKSVEEIEQRYIVEYKRPANQLFAYKFGYEKDNPSFKFLRFAILGEGDAVGLEETFYTLNLEFAKTYFDSRVQELFGAEGIDGFESLYRKLVNKLQFNVHYIQDDFDVFVAFETMNNRGKKLSNLEILKNRLIYLTTIYPADILGEDEKTKMRNDINDAWKDVYKYLGKNKAHPLDDDEYLRNHWFLYFKYSRKRGDDYVRFLLGDYFTAKAVYGVRRPTLIAEGEELEESEEEYSEYLEDTSIEDGILKPKEIADYVKSLKSIAPYWYLSFNPNESAYMTDEEKEWISKLNRVGINYFRTLVVAALADKKSSSDQRVKLFQTIERSIFVFFRMGRWNASYQSTVAYNFARELLSGDRDIDEITEALQSKFDSVKDEAVASFLANMERNFKNADGFYSWTDLGYFLFEYEMKLYAETHVPLLTNWDSFIVSKKDHISIEHIFPQTPTRYYWRNQFRGYTSEEFHFLANSLGNLLALSQSVNSALQNDEFADKKNPNGRRRGYSQGSHSEREVAEFADWTPETIKDRGLKLLAFMEERWGVTIPKEEKLKLLGLSFMEEERELPPELKREEVTSIIQLENSNSPLRDLVGIKIREYVEGLERKGLLHMLPSTNSNIRFAGVNARRKAGLSGDGSWAGIKDLIVFEFKNGKTNGVTIELFVGPSGDTPLRKKWHNFARNTKALGGRYGTMKKYWDPMIRRAVIAEPRDRFKSDDDYIQAVIDGVENFFSLRFNEIEEAFSSAPSDESDLVYSDTNLAPDTGEPNRNRHGFKDARFTSSLTNHEYLGTTGEDGTLSVYDITDGIVIPNNSTPSKKAIIGQAILDLGGEITPEDTLYQRYHRLTKLIFGSFGSNGCWIIPCSKARYDVDGAFGELGTIDWHQWINPSVGDTVYVYSSAPDSRIVYVAEVVETDIEHSDIDDSKFFLEPSDPSNERRRAMRLKMIRKLDIPGLSYAELKAHGLKGSMQGQCAVGEELQNYIESIVADK